MLLILVLTTLLQGLVLGYYQNDREEHDGVKRNSSGKAEHTGQDGNVGVGDDHGVESNASGK